LAKTCWELWNSWCFFWWWFEKKGDLRWFENGTNLYWAARMDHMWKKIGTTSFNGTNVASKNRGGNLQPRDKHSYKRIITKDRQVWRFEKLDS
jgi:hypothetical protein